MPEGPEVQVVVSTLERQLQDHTIAKVNVFYEKLIAYPSVDQFCQQLQGQKFHAFSRIGKYLLFTLDTSILVVHLRMEGRFYIYDRPPAFCKHIHSIWQMDDGRNVCYHDTRKFGRMWLYPKTEDVASLPALKNVGLDFTDPRTDAMYFYQQIHSAHRPLKMALLDQSIIAGIGNIYAAEICFACGLDPRSRCNRISKKDCANIILQMRKILSEAIACGGTTIRDYTSSLGVSGRFQIHLQVHARKGEPCPVCGRPIEKITVGQRGTYICRHCQKRK